MSQDEKQRRIDELEKENARLEYLMAELEALQPDTETLREAAMLQSHLEDCQAELAQARDRLEEVTFSFNRAGTNNGWDKVTVHMPPDDRVALIAWLERMNTEKPPGVPVQVEFTAPAT